MTRKTAAQIAAVAALLILAIVLFVQGRGSGGDQPSGGFGGGQLPGDGSVTAPTSAGAPTEAPPVTGAPTTAPTVPTSPSAVPTASGPQPVPQQSQNVDSPFSVPGSSQYQAAKVIEAMFGTTWEDPTPLAWIDRTAPFGTPAFVQGLRDTYGPGADSPSTMREFAQAAAEKRTVVAQIATARVVENAKHDDTEVVIQVTYKRATSAAGGTPYVGGITVRNVHMINVNGSWLADSVFEGGD